MTTSAFSSGLVRVGGGRAPRRSRAERDEAVGRLLADHPSWSDRRIAELCEVSPKLVGRIRTGLDLKAPDTKRVGRDGRRRPAQSGVLRGQIEAALRDNPKASLRTIASIVGASPETVRSVKRSITSEHETGQIQTARDAGHDGTGNLAALLHLTAPRRSVPSWSADAALASTENGPDFVTFFETTAVDGDIVYRACAVPLSRTYEIADEARRRAAYWSEFAKFLESRVRRPAAI